MQPQRRDDEATGTYSRSPAQVIGGDSLPIIVCEPTQEPSGPLPERRPPGELAPGTRVGEFLIERRHADGGMATIYLAKHESIGKRAAIKVLGPKLSRDPSAVQRLIREACSVNAIGHPNIVDIFSMGQLPDGRHYLVMEWIEGEDLFDRLSQGLLPVSESVEILDQIADALTAVHGAGFVHRDLKPDNVLLMAWRGRVLVKLLDFGIAKSLRPDRKDMHQTQAGLCVGTPAYMSPEQVRAEPIDASSDVYSLGVMAYEMLTGQHPFSPPEGRTGLTRFVGRRGREKITPARKLRPEIPRSLEAMVMRMMTPETSGRPSLEQVRIGLTEAAGRANEATAVLVGTPAPASPVEVQVSLPAKRERLLPIELETPMPLQGTPMALPMPASWRTARRAATFACTALAVVLAVGAVRSTLANPAWSHRVKSLAPLFIETPPSPLAFAGKVAPSAPTEASPDLRPAAGSAALHVEPVSPRSAGTATSPAAASAEAVPAAATGAAAAPAAVAEAAQAPQVAAITSSLGPARALSTGAASTLRARRRPAGARRAVRPLVRRAEPAVRTVRPQPVKALRAAPKKRVKAAPQPQRRRTELASAEWSHGR